MENTIYIKTYEPTPFDIKEILRYMGAKEETKEISDILSECIAEIENKLSYKVCFREFPVSFCDGMVDLGFLKSDSEDLSKNLTGCHKIILFGATIGIETDRLIKKYGVISPVKALMFQAIGAERIENLCDLFNNEIKENNYTKPRFSAGYGDFGLEFQKEIFNALNLPVKIGINLNNSLIMSPSKSVTAIIGITNNPNTKDCKSCDACNKKDCEFRRK